jgi:hypothetical protein
MKSCEAASYGKDAFHRVPIIPNNEGRGGTRPYQVQGQRYSALSLSRSVLLQRRFGVVRCTAPWFPTARPLTWSP